MRILLLVFAVLIGGAFSFQYLAQDDGITTYVTAPVESGRVTELVRATGTVDAVVTVEVGSQLSGQIAELDADFNDTVTRGQVLAVIDRRSFEAARDRAAADVAMAKAAFRVKAAELERAEHDLLDVKSKTGVYSARLSGAAAKLKAAAAIYDRSLKLRKSGSVSVKNHDNARAERALAAADVREAEIDGKSQRIRIAAAAADVDRKRAELAAAAAAVPERTAALRLAEIELERTAIRSPIDGVVINRKVDAGQTVASSLESPTLFTIAQNLSRMEVHTRIDESDIGRIALGQLARFSVDAFPGRVFEGKVEQIRQAATMIRSVVTYIVIIRTANQDRLLMPGMTATVDIVVFESADTVKLPSAALLYAPSGARPSTNSNGEALASVWRLATSGKPEQVSVETGVRDEFHTEIRGDSLLPGESVIVREVVTKSDAGGFLGLRFGF